MTRTLYEILGIHRDADGEEIRAAYLRAAKRWHPDTGEEGDAEKFLEVQAAYTVLKDNQKRELYDSTGETAPGENIGQIHAMAMQFIMANVQMIIDDEKIDIVKSDLCDMLRQLIEANLKGLQGVKEGVERKLGRYQTIIKKMIRKDDGENQIRRGLEGNVALLNNHLAAIEIEQVAKKFAQELLEKYGYDFDKVLVLPRHEAAEAWAAAHVQQRPQVGEFGFFRTPPLWPGGE